MSACRTFATRSPTCLTTHATRAKLWYRTMWVTTSLSVCTARHPTRWCGRRCGRRRGTAIDDTCLFSDFRHPGATKSDGTTITCVARDLPRVHPGPSEWIDVNVSVIKKIHILVRHTLSSVVLVPLLDTRDGVLLATVPAPSHKWRAGHSTTAGVPLVCGENASSTQLLMQALAFSTPRSRSGPCTDRAYEAATAKGAPQARSDL